MLVSLSDVLTSEGKVETVAIPLEMTSFKSRQGDFSIMEKTPIHLTFTNIGDAPLVIHQAVALQSLPLIRNVTGALLKYLQQ